MNNGMGETLIRHHRAEHHFRYLRFDAGHDKLVATQSLLKALLIKFVLLPCQANATIALIRHPWPGCVAKSCGKSSRNRCSAFC